MKGKEFSLLIGRWQCLPPHKGHISLIKNVLDEGKNVCIGLREADGGEKNPYNFKERRQAFEKIFEEEINKDRVRILEMPNILEVVHGRKVGWDIREIKLDKETENISATKIREKGNK